LLFKKVHKFYFASLYDWVSSFVAFIPGFLYLLDYNLTGRENNAEMGFLAAANLHNHNNIWC